MSRRVAFLLASGDDAERTTTALQLADALLTRGNRVTVYATGHAATLASGDGEVATAVMGLLRRGVHGATLDWVVDDAAARLAGVDDLHGWGHAPGVVPGGPADLWTFVRDADVVLAPGRGR